MYDVLKGAFAGFYTGSFRREEGCKDGINYYPAPDGFMTGEAITLLAVCKALKESHNGNSWDEKDVAAFTQANQNMLSRLYPNGRYNEETKLWVSDPEKNLFVLYENISAIKAIACGAVARSMREGKMLAKAVNYEARDNKEMIIGALSVADIIYRLKTERREASKEEMMENIILNVSKRYYDKDYMCTFQLDSIRENYRFCPTCEQTVPVALECFLESNDFDSTMRNALSLRGQCDMVAGVAGAFAGAWYGHVISPWIRYFHAMDDFQWGIHKNHIQKSIFMQSQQ